MVGQSIKCNLVTSNEAKYEAMVSRLDLSREYSVEYIEMKSNSQKSNLWKRKMWMQ